MQELGIARPQPEMMTLEERWEAAREVNAVHFASGLFDEDDIDSRIFQLAMGRALAKKGEHLLTIPLPELAEEFGLGAEAIRGIVYLLSGLVNPPKDEPMARVQDRLLAELPEGLGEVYLDDPSVPPEESTKIDLKTAIKMASTPCRLDR